MHVRRKFSPLVESSRIKVGHVIFAINRTKVLHSLYGFGIVTRSIVLTSSLKFLWSAVVKVQFCYRMTQLFGGMLLSTISMAAKGCEPLLQFPVLIIIFCRALNYKMPLYF